MRVPFFLKMHLFLILYGFGAIVWYALSLSSPYTLLNNTRARMCSILIEIGVFEFGLDDITLTITPPTTLLLFSPSQVPIILENSHLVRKYQIYACNLIVSDVYVWRLVGNVFHTQISYQIGKFSDTTMVELEQTKAFRPTNREGEETSENGCLRI